MQTSRQYHRPPYEDALSAWKSLLKEQGFSTEILWILEENLCFEKDPNDLAGVTLGFQTQFTPQPADAAKVTYHHFAEMDARLAFYRLGENRGRSICIQLCEDRKSTRLNSSHSSISYAVFCLKKKKSQIRTTYQKKKKRKKNIKTKLLINKITLE